MQTGKRLFRFLMIVFAEAIELLPSSASTRDLQASMAAARLAGGQIYTIPPDFSLCDTAENALYHVPMQSRPTPAWWTGYIPDFARYEAIYNAARAKNIVLLNSPVQHRLVQEFDLAYPFLKGLTPRSLVVTKIEQCHDAVQKLGLPLFVKGAVQSRKSRGWKACVAENEDELRVLVAQLLELEKRSRGRVLVRELLKLRHTRTHNDFPLGREFRVFLHRGAVLGSGYYWEGNDPLQVLNSEERATVEALAKKAALRLDAPLIAVDIGQTEDLRWLVIETGDPQFSGVSQIPLLPLWHRIAQIEQ